MLAELIIEDDWMSTPSRRYIAQAKPFGAKFQAVWAAPGLLPDYVYDGDSNVPQEFATRIEAEERARQVLFNALNRRAETKKKYSGKPMESLRLNGAEFAVELAESELNPEDFSTIWGTTPERVMEWIDDEKDVPFPIRWALPLLRLPGAKEMVFKIVEANINYKPKWLAFDAKRNRVQQLVDLIQPNLPRNADETTFKFQRAAQDPALKIDERVAILEEVVAELGLTLPGAPAAADSKTLRRG